MIVIERTVDLSKPISTETLRGNEFTGEIQAHTFKIHVVNGGVAVSLTGTVTAKMLLANGSGQMLGGSVEDGAAVVTLTQPCYQVPGRFHLAVYHTTGSGNDTHTTCIYSAVGSVVNTTGSPEYAPGNVIPTPEQLAEMVDELEDAIAENTYPVSYDTENPQELSEAQKAQARTNIGAASESAAAQMQAIDGLIDPGYQYTEQTDDGHNGVTVTRYGSRFALNGTRTGTSLDRYRVNGAFQYRSGSPTVSLNNGSTVLVQGHVYRMALRLISGTAVYSGSNANAIILSPFVSGTTTAWTIASEGAHSADGWQNRYVVGDGNAVTIWFTFRSDWVFTNAVYETLLQDVTETIKTDFAMQTLGAAIAPIENADTADAAHLAGSLILWKGGLYRVTADIAAGGAISGSVLKTTAAEAFAQNTDMERQIYPELKIMYASVGNATISRSYGTEKERALVWFYCKPSTLYRITKAPGQRFHVAEGTTSAPAYEGPIQNPVSDDTAGATELYYRTSASATFIAAFVWYETVDTSITRNAMCNSVRVYQCDQSEPFQEYPWTLRSSDNRSIFDNTRNYAFRKILTTTAASLQSIVYRDGYRYVMMGQAVRRYTPYGLWQSNSVPTFDHPHGCEMLDNGTIIVTASSDYGTAQETRGIYYYDFDTNTITDSIVSPNVPGNLVYASQKTQDSTDDFFCISWQNAANELHFWSYKRSTDTATEIGTGVTLPNTYFQGACRVGNVWYITTSGAANPGFVRVKVNTGEYIGMITCRGFNEIEGIHVTCDDTGAVYGHFCDNTNDTIYMMRF